MSPHAEHKGLLLATKAGRPTRVGLSAGHTSHSPAGSLHNGSLEVPAHECPAGTQTDPGSYRAEGAEKADGSGGMQTAGALQGNPSWPAGDWEQSLASCGATLSSVQAATPGSPRPGMAACLWFALAELLARCADTRECEYLTCQLATQPLPPRMGLFLSLF